MTGMAGLCARAGNVQDAAPPNSARKSRRLIRSNVLYPAALNPVLAMFAPTGITWSPMSADPVMFT